MTGSTGSTGPASGAETADAPRTGDEPVDPALAALGYPEALAELERILQELEGDAIDVDRLGAQVQRAAALIRLCRDRIGTARLQIEQVVADLG